MIVLKRIGRALCFVAIGVAVIPLRLARESVDLVLDVAIDVRDALAGGYD